MATNDPTYDPKVDPELDELIAGYVLDTLTPDERSKAETALSASQQARQLRSIYQEAFGAYASLTPPRRAPAGGEEKLRTRLAAEPRRAALTSQSTAQPTTNRFALPINRRRAILYGTLAAIALIVFGGLFVYNRSTYNQRSINAILQDPKAIRVAMQRQPSQPPTTGKVTAVAVPGDTRMVLLAELPPLTTNQQYQLWFIEGQDIRSGGVFSPDTTEQQLLVDVPSPTQEYTLGLTVEPAGGSQQPTRPPLFSGKLPRLKP